MGDSGTSSWIAGAVGRGHKVAILVAAAAVLAFAALLGVARAAGYRHVWALARHPSWPWIGVAFVAEVVAYVGYTVAYREIVRAEHGAELEVPKAAALVATGFGVFLQGGGFRLDREALKSAGLPPREARRRVLGLGALEYSVLGPATAIAAAVVLARGMPVSGSLTLPWVVGVPAGAVLAAVALRFRSRLAGKDGVRARVDHALRAAELVLRLASPRGATGPPSPGSPCIGSATSPACGRACTSSTAMHRRSHN